MCCLDHVTLLDENNLKSIYVWFLKNNCFEFCHTINAFAMSINICTDYENKQLIKLYSTMKILVYIQNLVINQVVINQSWPYSHGFKAGNHAFKMIQTMHESVKIMENYIGFEIFKILLPIKKLFVGKY